MPYRLPWETPRENMIKDIEVAKSKIKDLSEKASQLTACEDTDQNADALSNIVAQLVTHVAEHHDEHENVDLPATLKGIIMSYTEHTIQNALSECLPIFIEAKIIIKAMEKLKNEVETELREDLDKTLADILNTGGDSNKP